MDIVVFTDGSCSKNGSHDATGAYSCVFPNGQFESIGRKLIKEPGFPITNNRAEYMAAIVAIESVIEMDPAYTRHMYIYTDSQLLINTVTLWMEKWEKNDWKKKDSKIKNLDLVKRLFNLTRKRTVYWAHIKAHSGLDDYFSRWNDVADKLAQEVNKRE